MMFDPDSTLRVPYVTPSEFANGKVAWDLIRRAGTFLEHSRQLQHLDLSLVQHAKPYAATVIVGLCRLLGSTDPTVSWPTNGKAREHLCRIGMPNVIGVAAPETVQQRDTNLAIEVLQNRPPDDFAYRVTGLLVQELGCELPGGIEPQIADSLSEIILNAMTHAESPIGCVVAGQAFPQTHTIEVAVLDLGITILGHLQRRFENLQTDSDAILEAVRVGVTGTVGRNRFGEPNSGSGLAVAREFLDSTKGELAIISGSALVSFCSGQEYVHAIYPPKFGGTLVNMKFNTKI